MNNIPHDRKPHPHQAIINAWAEGKNIQCRAEGEPWFDCDKLFAPSFLPLYEYRIKPEPKPAYALYAQVYLSSNKKQCCSDLGPVPSSIDNVEFTFNGDTHQLIDAKII